MINDDKIQAPLKDEINRIDKVHTSPKNVVKIDIKAHISINLKQFLIKFLKIA